MFVAICCARDRRSSRFDGQQERNLHYVVHIEVFLAKAFGFMPVDEEDEQV